MDKLYENNEEKEFTYYQNCFTWTLRNGQWKKIPNNTLAEGDIIRLLPDERAPALIEAQIENIEIPKGFASVGISKTPSLGGQGTMFFNKGSKIGISNFVLRGQRCSTSENIDGNEAFQKCMKEYQIFKVLKTPCVQDLTEFITNMEPRKNYSKNLLYFRNVKKAETIINILQGIFWVSSFAINIAYLFKGYTINYFDHHTYLPIIGFSFVIPQIFTICEAWANALMLTLFNSLQSQDYNKKLIGKHNFFKLLKKSKNQENVANIQLLDNNMKKKQKKQSVWERIKNLCTQKKPKSDHRKRKNHKKSDQGEQLKEMITGFVKTKDFYENYDFQNRGIKKNLPKFLEFVRTGSNHMNNIFAAMSSASVFAFVDKEGIVSETGKYVDEIAMIDKQGQKTVLDLMHDTHVNKEEEIYSFENPSILTENIPLLRSLGLAFMLTRNPKETDIDDQLKEIFTTDYALHEQIKNQIGFHFHNALKSETEAHEDCLCSISKLIGHSEASFHNYNHQFSIWNIKPNKPIEEKDVNKKKAKEKKEKQHRSFDDASDNESEIENLVGDMQSQEDDERSVRSVESLIVNPIFAEQKQHKKIFGHILTHIVYDKQALKMQSFTRGEANIIFSHCSDYWNGEKIVPIKKEVKHHIKDILFQWQATDFVTIGFSYKPVTPDLLQIIQNSIHEDDYRVKKEIFEQFQKNQIFLGIVGLKHHRKLEANKMFQSMEEGGIRGVLFSKEGVLETKSLAKELGIDSDWNAWISLAEIPSDFTVLCNQDGHLILPYGINGIKKHIEEVDKIPLQVPMFCDATPESTRQMFEIYQEHGDVVVCIGNIINSENLHIFQQANIAIGMMIEPQYKCYRCNGRITKIQKYQQGINLFARPNAKVKDYKPSKLERLSAGINALACTFVFDANTNIYCFYPVFREARRLREGVEQAFLLASYLYLCVFIILFLDLVLGLHHYLSQLETCYVLFLSIPLAAFSCLSRPSKNSMMKRSVLSPKYLPYLDYAIFLLKSAAFKIVMTAIIIYVIRLYYFYNAIKYFKQEFPNEYQIAFNPKQENHFSYWKELNTLLLAGWFDLKKNYEYWQITFEFEHKFNFCYMLLIFCYLQIGFESPLYTVIYKFTKNKIFRYQLLLQILFIIFYYALATTIFLGPSSQIRNRSNHYYPAYDIWIICFVGLLIISVFEELTKRTIRKLFQRDHSRLMIFFSTKLGMWSPR